MEGGRKQRQIDPKTVACFSSGIGYIGVFMPLLSMMGFEADLLVMHGEPETVCEFADAIYT